MVSSLYRFIDHFEYQNPRKKKKNKLNKKMIIDNDSRTWLGKIVRKKENLDI